ncbi:MAG: NAD(P)/FAD-dependent oxidoreductase [Candidatus Dormibacteraceae bacterium]
MDRIVVVGGGIVGASAAYELACRGIGITLVDREDEGYATQAGAGIVSGASARGGKPGWLPLMQGGVAHYAGLLDRLSEDGIEESGYSSTEGLIVALPDERADLEATRARLIDEAKDDPSGGSRFDLLTPSEARQLFPALDERLTAIHVSRAARVDGRTFRQSLRWALQRRGGLVLTGDAAIRLERGRAIGIRLDGRNIDADAILLCTGAWAPELLRDHLPHLPVAPQRGQIIHLALPGQGIGGWPFVVGYHSHYLLPFPDRVVVGATREAGSGFDYRFTAQGVNEVLSEALRIAPGLASATLREMRIGFRPLSGDGLPLLGRVPGVEGLILATGTGPSGLTVGPYCGAIAATLALGEPAPIDLGAYAPDRQTSPPLASPGGKE